VPPAEKRTVRTSTTEENYQQVMVRMPADMHAAVKERAVEEDRTMSHTIRRAVRLYLEDANA